MPFVPALVQRCGLLLASWIQWLHHVMSSFGNEPFHSADKRHALPEAVVQLGKCHYSKHTENQLSGSVIFLENILVEVAEPAHLEGASNSLRHAEEIVCLRKSV